MNKCTKCGTEFEGNFCPECGEPWKAGGEKFCPRCGTKEKANAKFCRKCGYSFESNSMSSPTPQAENVFLIICKTMKYLPEALFILMSALAFAFLAAPVMQFGGVNVGNAYEVFSIEEISELRETTIGFITVTAFGVIYSLYLVFVNILDLKDGFAVKPTYTAIVLYLAYIIIGSIMISQVTSSDGGLGIVTAGACPICFIVFGAVFSVLSVAALLVREKSDVKKR